MMESLRDMIHGRNHSTADLGAYLVLGIMIGATLYAFDMYGENLIWTNVGLMGLALFIMFGTRRIISKYMRLTRAERAQMESNRIERAMQAASLRERECGRCGVVYGSREEMLGHSCPWSVYY